MLMKGMKMGSHIKILQNSLIDNGTVCEYDLWYFSMNSDFVYFETP